MEKKTICSLFVLIGIMMLQLQWKSEPEIIRILHAQIEALETVVNNLKELAFSAVKIFDVNNDPKAFSKRLDTTIDFLAASNVWFFKNIIPAAEADLNCRFRSRSFRERRGGGYPVSLRNGGKKRTPPRRLHIKSTTSKPKTRARTTRKLSTVSTNSPRVRPTPRSETSARPSSKPEYKSNVPNLSTTPLPSSPDDWTTQASSPSVGTFTTNKAKLIHVKISSVNLNPTGSRHVYIVTQKKTGSDNYNSVTQKKTGSDNYNSTTENKTGSDNFKSVAFLNLSFSSNLQITATERKTGSDNVSSATENKTGSDNFNSATESKTGSDNVSSATENKTESDTVSSTETTLKEGRCLLDMEDVKIVEKQLGNLVMDIENENDPVFRLEQILEKKVEVVLLCCSIGAITIYFIVLLVLRVEITEKIFVHVNMLLSLGIAHLVYVLDFTVFTNRVEHPVLCSTVVVTLHFLETALFTWMFVEGINLYNKLVKVFSMRKQYLAFAAIGWGIPAVIVGITAAIKPSAYDTEAPLKEVICGPFNFTGRPERERCWLSGSTWIYKGPVLFFLLVNMGMFLILLRVIFGKLSNKYNKEHVTFARKGLRSMLALLPLLGVTYILGYFLQFHIAVQYLFVLLNSTQGVTFTIFHCLFDDQITEGLKKLCGKNTVPQKPRKNPKTPKETNKKKSKDGAHPTIVKVVKMNGANQTTKGTNV